MLAITPTYSKESAELSDESSYRIRVYNSLTDVQYSVCLAISNVCKVVVKTCGYAKAKQNGRWADPET